MFMVVWVILVILIVVSVVIQLKKSKYHEAGEAEDPLVDEEYGTPIRSLYLSTKILTLHQSSDITDDREQVAYHAESKMISLHDRTEITDGKGNFVSRFNAKLISIHNRYFIEMADGKEFQLASELLHVYKSVINIDELGWVLEGNMWRMHFTIKNKDGKLLAFISQKVISMHDKYSVDIYDEEAEPYIITVLVVLQHIMRRQRQAEQSNSTSASSSN